MGALYKWSLWFFVGFATSAYADAVRLTLKVEFRKGSRIVEPAYIPLVAEVAKFLEKYPDANATIEGHSDNVGSDALNLRLSQGRADSVRELLILRFAIDPRRLKAVGYGKSQPIADNATEEGRFKNRRVVASLEAEEGTFAEEKSEIDLAVPPKPVDPPPPVAAPVKPAEDEDNDVTWGPRFQAGLVSGPSGLGLSYAWNPIVYRKKRFKASGYVGLMHLNDRNRQGFFAMELGYILSMNVVADGDIDLGAMLVNVSGAISGGMFEAYAGFTYNTRLRYLTRVTAAYTPLLQKNNNIQAVRLLLGFEF